MGERAPVSRGLETERAGAGPALEPPGWGFQDAGLPGGARQGPRAPRLGRGAVGSRLKIRRPPPPDRGGRAGRGEAGAGSQSGGLARAGARGPRGQPAEVPNPVPASLGTDTRDCVSGTARLAGISALGCL